MSPARSPSASPPVVSQPPRAARRVRREWANLCSPTPHPAAFDPAMVTGLPEPARRYLTHAIAPGTPLWQSVEISMVGHIKIGAWRPFTATQVVAPRRGYIWAADARLFGIPVIGYDRLRRRCRCRRGRVRRVGAARVLGRRRLRRHVVVGLFPAAAADQ